MRKKIDIFPSCAKIQRICKNFGETKQVKSLRSERETVKALRCFFCKPLPFVAREDRDGCSRY